jgi:hypothetical protein
MFNVQTVERYLETHRRGARDLSSQLWLLLSFALFLEGEKIRRLPRAA